MKIAQINPGHMPIPPDKWGAVEKIIWYYKLESERKGHEVHIKYINEIDKGEYDIVHVHMWNHALEMYEKSIPYVFTCHDHHAFVHGKNSEVYSNNLTAMKNSTISFVPATYLVDYFEGLPKYLRHGIDPEEFYVGESNEIPKLLVVGNNGLSGDVHYDRKGFRYAIEAAEKLNMPITIVGPTDCNKQFFTHHSDLLKDSVDIKYDLTDDELRNVYRSHDILIHASSVEAGHPPLTLLEAASSGLPIISTECSGELYTTKTNRDVDDVVQSVKDVLKLYALTRAKTLKSVQNFYWTNVVDELLSEYQKTFVKKDMRSSVMSIYTQIKRQDKTKNAISVNFLEGPFVEITGPYDKNYTVKFIDMSNNSIVYQTSLGTNQWARCNRKWATKWKIEVVSSDDDVFEYIFNPERKRVLISLESSSLGDTLAWVPYAEEFRKKYNCEVIVSTFLNSLFQDQYSEIKFVEPGTVVHDLYALYRLGIFTDGTEFDSNKHKRDYKKLKLQEVATDILGLDFKEIRPRIKRPTPMKSEKPYVCIANHSTAQSKYWNNQTGWQELVDYVKSLGYDVYLLSKEEDGFMGNINPYGVIKINNKTLEEISDILVGSSGFVGISSGLSWLAWVLEVPMVLISGFTESNLEMENGVFRIINENVCNGCFNRHIFDKGDWNWCPDHKGTPRQFECTKTITFDMVKPSLNQMLKI